MLPKSFKLFSFFWSYSRWLVIFSIMTGVIAGGSSAALMVMINSRITGAMDVSSFAVWAFVTFAALVLLAATASGILSSHLAQRSSLHLRLYLCRKILGTPLRTVEEAGAHRLLTALTQDIGVLVNAFLRVPPLFINFAIVLGGLIYLGWLSPLMLLVLIGFVVLGIISYILPQRRANRYLDAAREEFSSLMNHFRALISGFKELTLHRYRRAAFFAEVVEPTAVSLQQQTMKGEKLYVLLNSWSQILYFIIIGLILFAMPSVVGQLNLAILSGYALTVLYISGPIQSLVNIVPALSQATISLRKLEELGLFLNASDVIREQEDMSAQPETAAEWQKLELRGITHSYYREKEASSFVLGPVDLTLTPGELVFVVGGNGSGKTTFAKLLCGLYRPEQGEIRLDDVPIREQNIDDYRQYFSVVFTEFHLFEQLLGINNEDLDRTAHEYLAQLQLDHKVEIKDGKLSTTELSYGQRKRLALLTAYMEDRPLYIFDEWAADQDPLFRDIFYNNILAGLKARGKTIIVISHDDRYYHMADRLIKLEYGKLEYDRHLKESQTEAGLHIGSENLPYVDGDAVRHENFKLVESERLAQAGLGQLNTGQLARAVEQTGNGTPHPSSLSMPQAGSDEAARSTPPTPSPRPTASPRQNGAAFLLIVLFIASAVFFTTYEQRPPNPVKASAPLNQFSSERAMQHLKVIAQAPRPTGSRAQEDVREYILGVLRDAGLQPEIQNTVAVRQTSTSSVAASVQNITARLEGAGPDNHAVMLVAHYDSVPNSPGASDAGAGVAALLETLRALRTESPLKNDLVLLFTDAEEPGLLGARAFVGEHAWTKDIKLALNFEARGSRGPVFMFETSDQNGWLIEEFGRSAPRPFANSLMHSIYKLLPNDTDMTVFRRAGMAGLNFAFIDGARQYHTSHDSLRTIDERSLQHHGTYALALARHFGNQSLENTRARDAVYFDLLGYTLFIYPQAWVMPLTVMSVMLLAALLFLGFRKRVLTPRGTALGLVVFILSAALSAVLVSLCWWGTKALHSDFTARTNATAFLISFVSLTLCLTLLIYHLFNRWTNLNNLAVGALCGWAALLVLSSLYLPGASYLLMWPLLFAIVGAAFLFFNENRRLHSMVRPAVLCLSLIPGILLVTSVLNNLFQGLGMGMPAVIVILAVVLIGLLIPLLRYITPAYRRLLISACMLVGVSFLVIGNITPAHDRDNPKTNTITYNLDADTGQTTWISNDRRPDKWTSQFFPAVAGVDAQGSASNISMQNSLVGPAPPVELTKDEVRVLDDSVIDGTRRIRAHVTPSRDVRIYHLYVDPSTDVSAAVVNGKRLDYSDRHQQQGQSARGFELSYIGVPDDGIELVLETKSSGPLKLRLTSYADGLPEIPGFNIKARPDDLIPSANSDTTRVVATFDLGLSDRAQK